MKKNIFELFRYVYFTMFFYIKLIWFRQSLNFSLVGFKRNHFIYGSVNVRGRVYRLSVDRYLRVLGPVSLIYSDDRCGELIVGSDVIFEEGATLAPRQGKIEIGNGCFIGPGVLIQAFKSANIVVGNNTMIAKDAIILSSNHDISNPGLGYQRETGSAVKIGSNVWIGAGAKILAGVEVGDYSIIAAGAVVTKKVDEYSIYAGTPAVKIKQYDVKLSQWLNCYLA